MAIQMRRGIHEKFDPTKMLAGEWAVVLSGDPNTASGRAIYHCFATGQVERVATYVEAAQFVINLIPDIVDALTDAVQEAESDREDAESDREDAESARVLAESNRQTAEGVRESKVITSASATVDANVGTPSVQVSLGQPSASGRSITFTFRNLKGETGAQGPKGDTVSVDPVTNAQIDAVVADTPVTSDLYALTPTGLTYLWGKLKAAFAALAHTHSTDDITSGTLPVARGGTGHGATIEETTVSNIVQSAGTDCQIVGAKYYRWGNVIHLYIAVKANVAKSVGDVLATVETGLRPGVAAQLVNTANLAQLCAIYPDGGIQAKSAVVAGSTVYLVGTYLIYS